MSHRLIKDPLDTQAELLPISSKTVTNGMVLELDVGATTWTLGDASTEHWQKKAIAMESATTSAVEVKAKMIAEGQLYEVDLANNSNSDHNGDRMILSAGGLTVNNTGSDVTGKEAVFIQKAPVGPTADAKAIGWFVAGTGINPDAS